MATVEVVCIYVVCRRASVDFEAHEFVIDCFDDVDSARDFIQSKQDGWWSLYEIQGAAKRRLRTQEYELA